MQAQQRLGIQPVSLPETVGNERDRVGAQQAQRPKEHGRSGYTIDVVVAVHRDAAARLERVDGRLYGLPHVAEQERVVQLVRARSQEPSCIVRVAQTPTRENLGGDCVDAEVPRQSRGGIVVRR